MGEEKKVDGEQKKLSSEERDKLREEQRQKKLADVEKRKEEEKKRHAKFVKNRNAEKRKLEMQDPEAKKKAKEREIASQAKMFRKIKKFFPDNVDIVKECEFIRAGKIFKKEIRSNIVREFSFEDLLDILENGCVTLRPGLGVNKPYYYLDKEQNCIIDENGSVVCGDDGKPSAYSVKDSGMITCKGRIVWQKRTDGEFFGAKE